MARKGGLTPMWSDKEVERWFDYYVDRAEERIYRLLQRAGEEFVKIARKEGKYQDWTGNLRSSIGYVIVKNGHIVDFSSFDKVQGAGENISIVKFTTKDGKVVNFRAKGASGNGEEGPKAGFRLAIQLASEYTTGYVLICLAGMKYAVYVEAMENKDVISSASDHTEEWIKKQSRTLFDKLAEKGY